MKFIVYRDPKNSYESFVERFCLRGRASNRFAEKKDLVSDAEFVWREKKFSSNKDTLNECVC